MTIRKAVTMPIAGSITVFIDVDDNATEEEMLDEAYEQADFRIDAGPSTEPGELDALGHICQGNLCYAPLLHYSIEDDE